MLSHKKADQLVDELYELLYKYSVPSVDFKTLVAECTLYRDKMNNPIRTDEPLSVYEMKERELTKDLDFYSYFLPKDVYDNIVKFLEKKYRVSGSDRRALHMVAYLGAGPSSNVTRYLEKHPEQTVEDLQKLVNAMDYGEFIPELPIIVKKEV